MKKNKVAYQGELGAYSHIAINELLPLLSTRQVDSATQVVIENFSNISEKENDS